MKQVLKIGYKRQTTIAVMFVLVGMMFLVPTITEKALAVIAAEAATKPCCFAEFDKRSFLNCNSIASFCKHATNCPHFH